jgi:hypothetical protein
VSIMDQRRRNLQTLLETMGAMVVYFQPPSDVQMQYPCIVYQRYQADVKSADNIPYRYTKRYQVTVIDPNPESDIPDKVKALPMCLYNRFFKADNLNHDVFDLYF